MTQPTTQTEKQPNLLTTLLENNTTITPYNSISVINTFLMHLHINFVQILKVTATQFNHI